MINQVKDKYFELHTDNSSYVFCVLETGHLEHLHYGGRIKVRDVGFLKQKRSFAQGNMNSYDQDHIALCLENLNQEISSLGKSDIRDPFVELRHADGSSTCDFLYESAQILPGAVPMETLPSSYGDAEDVQTLLVVLRDAQYDLKLELYYTVYPSCDVITRRAVLVNESENKTIINRLMSTQLDLDMNDLYMTSFHGNWGREMAKYTQQVCGGTVSSGTVMGCSSSRSNPFVMLHEKETTENSGKCFGINLVYSGNHLESAQPNVFGRTRFLSGINPMNFSYELLPGERFETPEAVMTYSGNGFTGMSHNMHRFVRNHIVRGAWQFKERPILLNSWEAAYFDINESKLMRLAEAAADAGIELFVMDDGWFGARDDDTTSLGDWFVNTKKLPQGLAHLADRIKKLGLQFGIWVEPEMISVDSDLYRKHPEWAMDVPGKPHTEGRNQRILDLVSTDVQDYLIETLTEVFGSADISYVKWDMNRFFSDIFSKSLPADRQGETAHRYMIGLYRVMKTLTERFPEILFEGCASGGNRFDLGTLCYFPQIWGSDDTDAMCRLQIQKNYSYGYPLSTVGSHVSACPNHQTQRVTPLATRYNVASFGVLGYECNLADMDKDDRKEIKEQVALYKRWREVMQFGDFYRGEEGSKCDSFYGGITDGPLTTYTVVSPDREKAVAMIAQGMIEPNPGDVRMHLRGMDEDKLYRFYNLPRRYDLLEFGDLINTAAPIHVRQDSLLHKAIAKFVSMPGETEEELIYGDALEESGVMLTAPFSATGYSEQVRYFPDFASRMYFAEAVCDEEQE